MDMINHVQFTERDVAVIIVVGIIVLIVYWGSGRDPWGVVRRAEYRHRQRRCEEMVTLGMCLHIEERRHHIGWHLLKPTIIEYARRQRDSPRHHSSLKQMRFHLTSLCAERDMRGQLNLIDELFDYLNALMIEHDLNPATRMCGHRIFKSVTRQLRWVF